MEHVNGLIAAPFTPLDKDGNLNLPLIPHYYEFLKHNGVKGAFVCGSTGEGVSLTLEERKAVARAWRVAAVSDADFKIVLFVGGTCLAECKELARFAQEVGLDAVSFAAPYYFRPPDVDTLASCCKEIADSVPGMPFYYYHIPAFTGVDFPMIDLLKNVHRKIPNFAGIKYTHENFMDLLSCVHFQDGKYDILCGRDENLLPALALGCKGAVGSTYNYAAPLYYDLINAFNANDLQKARACQQRSVDMIALLPKYGGMATGKAFMKLVNLDCGEFRLPVRNMDKAQFERLKKDTEEINFNNFCSRGKS